MRYIYLIAFLCCGCLTLVAQQTSFFFTDHGESETPRSPDAEISIQAPNGDFIFVVTRKNPTTDVRNVVLYLISAEDATVLDSTEVELEDAQYVTDISRAENGHYWVTGSTVVFQENNRSDILLMEFDENLNFLTSYTFDEDRFEVGLSVVNASATTVSMLTTGRFALNDVVNYTIRTLSTEDGSIITDVALPELTNSTSTSLTAGAANKVLVYSSVGLDNGFITLDVQSGTVESSMFPVIDASCPQTSINGPYTKNVLYDDEAAVYLTMDACFNVYRINQDGSFEVSSSDFGNAEPFTAAFRMFIQMVNDTLQVFDGARSHRFEIGADDVYTLASTVFTNVLSLREIHSVSSTDKNIIYRINDDPESVVIQDFATSTVTPVSDLSHLLSFSSFIVSRAIDLGNEELLVAEDFSNGAKILFYDLDGNCLDSLPINYGVEADLQGFSIGPEGDYRAIIYVRGNDNYYIELIQFNREEGIINTLYTLDELSPTFSGIYASAVSQDNGDLYFTFVTFDEMFNTVRQIIGVDPSGNEIFNARYIEGQNNTVRFAQFAVDPAGKVYAVYAGLDGDQVLVQEFTDGGNEVEEYMLDFTELEISSVWDISVNQAGTKLIFTAFGKGEVGNLPVIVETDLENNSLLRILPLAVEVTRNLTIPGLADYQPDSDNIIALSQRYNPAATIVEQEETVFQVFNATGSFYEETVLMGRNGFFLYDMVLNNAFDVYFCGARANDFSASKSAIMGINYNDAVSVKEVDDLAATTNLKVFPNPTAAQSTITWDQQKAGNYELELLNAEGRRVARWAGALTPGRATVNVDLSRQPVGTYLLQLTTNAGVTTQRIVKQ